MVIAFIPVRGGSKSIPLKNIKPFCGKPLVYWNLLALQNTKLVDEIVVATDSKDIEETVQSFKFSKVKVYQRCAENAADTSSTESVMIEYLSKVNLSPNDYFMLVQATSPLTQSSHFEGGINLLINENKDSVLSCVKTKRFFWNNDGTPLNYDYKNRPRRQDFDGMFLENGAFYINTVKNILVSQNRLSGNIGIYEMPEYTSFEIDEPSDWLIIEQLMKNHVLVDSKPSNIRLVLSDVDGVLTDAGMYYAENGDELKKFNTHDGMGFRLLKENGIKTGIITSECTKIVENRAKKLKLDYLHQGKRDGGKLQAAKEICEKEGISLSNVAYIGDDINCFELLSNVGLAACPSDAMAQIKSVPNIQIMSLKGGEGVLREFVELILNNRK